MTEAGSSVGHKIGHAMLVTSAVTVVFILMGLALLVTLILAPPLAMMEHSRREAP